MAAGSAFFFSALGGSGMLLALGNSGMLTLGKESFGTSIIMGGCCGLGGATAEAGLIEAADVVAVVFGPSKLGKVNDGISSF